jgi:hypothetical protein
VGCNRKYTDFLSYFNGETGVAEFYLDMARFERWESLAMDSARQLIDGCSLFAIDREEDIAFPGESLHRISCDLGTGGARVALVMHRYIDRSGATLMLHDLIPEWSARDRARVVASAHALEPASVID